MILPNLVLLCGVYRMTEVRMNVDLLERFSDIQLLSYRYNPYLVPVGLFNRQFISVVRSSDPTHYIARGCADVAQRGLQTCDGS